MSNRYRFLAPVLLLLSAAPALAGVPSPANSTVPACGVFCPSADLAFTVVVRDFANSPVPGSTVVLDFCACGQQLCAPPGPGDDHVPYGPCGFAKTTNAAGVATFHVHIGNVCGGSNFRIYADGVLLASRNVATPDQSGDMFVGDLDAAILATKVGTLDPTGDLDCDGAVTSADEAFLQAHWEHTCIIPNETRRSRWGDLKLLYR